MRKVRVAGARFILFGIVLVGVTGLVTVGLWNALMPAILGLPAIGFWQALGLLLLSRLLFGRLGGWRRGMHKARFVRGWTNLTPEERQRFHQAMGQCHPGRCGEGEAASSPASGE